MSGNVVPKIEPTIHVEPKMNLLYFKTPPGIIKIIQLVFGIICFSCVCPVDPGFMHYFFFISVVCFAITAFLCAVYLLSVNEQVVHVPWLLLELYYTGGAALFLLIAAVVELVLSSLWRSSLTDRYLAAGSFALFNTVTYAAGFFFLFKTWKCSRVPPTATAQ